MSAKPLALLLPSIRSLASSRYLNYASMVLPSNDAFIANGNPQAHEIFDGNGNFLGADFVVTGEEVLDAGTEVNDEAETSTAFFGQAEPNTGETEAGVVQTHPGFNPEGRILSSTEFANADFTTDSYNVARITVTTEDLQTISTEGTDGADYLLGDNGFDRLSGGDGDDLLDGAEGTTIYEGGMGSDTFIVHNDGLTDWVKDFELGTDIIELTDGITYDGLEITGSVNSFISFEGQEVAVLLGVNSEELTAGNFSQR